MDDRLYARATLARNATTLQVLHSNGNLFAGRTTHTAWELVVATPSCMNGRATVSGACPPDEVELRSGLHADAACECRNRPRLSRRERFPGIINCASMTSRLELA